MTTCYFGDRWDAPMLDGDAEQVPTPVGVDCYACTEPVDTGDRGVIRPYVTLVDGGGYGAQALPIHIECDLLAILGHELGVCSCTGHGKSRADALELLARVNARRAAQGRKPL